MSLQDVVRERVRTTQREHRLPGLTIAVARGGPGGERSAASAGFAVAAHGDAPGRRAEPGTPYRIGSITKTFTAALVLLLAERGLLDVDEPVRRYLPGAGEAVGRARLRQLLTHSGGLPVEVPLPVWAAGDGPEAEALLAALPAVEPVGRPGTRWHYSNLGYDVLGQVVEAVVGSRCDDLVDRELLLPLGLRRTTWQRPPDTAAGYLVDPYDDRLHPQPDTDLRARRVSGQLWSTAADLLAWADALCGGAPHVVPDEVAAAMRTPHVIVDPDAWTQAWGLGLGLRRRDGHVVAEHGGSMPGHLAAVAFEAGSRTAAVVLTNGTAGIDPSGLAVEVLLAALAELPPADDDAAEWTPRPAPPELAGVLGRWFFGPFETLLTWRDGALRAGPADEPEDARSRFDPDGEDRWLAVEGRLAGEALVVRREADGRVRGIDLATYPHTREPQPAATGTGRVRPGS
jgi:CubicO group peptidase (beta-lactamase class C family)